VSARIVLATHNRDKVTEIRRVLDGLDVELVAAVDLPDAPEVEETGTTLEENARLKAIETSRTLGLPALADDTGLEVDALDGAPGVYAARYSGPGATYASNCAKLLREMSGVPDAARGARFRTVVAFAHPDGSCETVDGACPGEILREATGEGGFGYDPVFRPEGETRSFAAMSLAEKNAISHRARAFRAARSLVERWLASR